MMDAIIQWLNANTVANEPKLALFGVPECNGEHAAETLNAIDSPFLKGMQDHFRVGMICSPDVTSTLLQFGPDFGMVVDLTIENYPEAAVLIAHGLSGALG